MARTYDQPGVYDLAGVSYNGGVPNFATTCDPTNSRVQITEAAIPNLNGLGIIIERQVTGGAWTPVRGAFPAIPNATTFAVNDYEFVPNIQNCYRSRTDVFYDTFARTVASSWGTADSGQTYVATGGTATDFNVPAGFNFGTILQSTANVVRTQTLTIKPDTDSYADIALNGFTATGASANAGILARRSDASNYYYANLEFTVSATMNLSIHEVVGGVDAVIAGPFAVGSYTGSSGQFFRLRFRAQGTSLFAKVWNPSTTPVEPNAWTLTVSDSSLSAGPGVGAYARTNAGNTNTTGLVIFDNFHSADISATGATFSLLGTSCVTCTQTGAFLKFPLRPFLNEAITLCNWTDEVRPARGTIFQILGRNLPIAVTELRSSRQFTILIKCVDSAAADQLALALSFGDIAYLQTPGPTVYCGLARRSYPQAGYFFLGDATFQRVADGRPTYMVTIPVTEVAPPDYAILGSSATWQGLEAGFATWAAVEAAFASWNAVNQYVSSPSSEIVG